MSKSKRLIYLLFIIFCAVVVGLCYAALKSRSNAAINTFELGQVSCKVEDTFDGAVTNNTTVKNTSGISAFIRSQIVVNWMSEDGKEVLSEVPELDTDYTLDINTTDWFLGSDGYYYYNKTINIDDNTNPLINEAKLKDGITPPDGYYLSVEVISSAIQAKPERAVTEAWGVVEANGNDLSAK